MMDELGEQNGEHPLALAAAHYYDACDLYEDEALDPDNHLKVVTRAFMSSDCDDFASLMHDITGWQNVRVSWNIPDWGFGHHAAVRAPDGRLLDVRGWGTEDSVRKYFRLKPEVATKVIECKPSEPFGYTADPEDKVFALLLDAVEALPRQPFKGKAFKEMLENYRSRLQAESLPTP